MRNEQNLGRRDTGGGDFTDRRDRDEIGGTASNGISETGTLGVEVPVVSPRGKGTPLVDDPRGPRGTAGPEHPRG